MYPKMYLNTVVILIITVVTVASAEDEVKDFDFENDQSEIMIAQESRQYDSRSKSPIKIIKPSGVTNSHRPQYNIDSEEEYMSLNNKEDPATKNQLKPDPDLKIEETQNPKKDVVNKKEDEVPKKDDLKKEGVKKDKYYRPSYKLRSKEGTIRDAVLRALERKDHVGKFAQILPIIRSMSGTQRVALASLVASQVTTPLDRRPLDLAQVRSMFGTNHNTTTDLMLPILLDTANLIRRANKPGKQTREVKPQDISQTAISRRSDIDIDDEPFETFEDTATSTTTTQATKVQNRNTLRKVKTRPNKTQNQTKATDNSIKNANTTDNTIDTDDTKDNKNSTRRLPSTSTTVASPFSSPVAINTSSSSNKDLTADSTQSSSNQTSQDSPVAEKLRASYNRHVERKGNLRRGSYPKPSPPGPRRTTSEPTLTPIIRKRPGSSASPPTSRKPLPEVAADGQCELFTNSLCLHSDGYPTDAIVQSIRRNKAAAGALLADFQEPKEGALDGVTAAQEAKYTPEHYLTSNRRGDTANRDFAGAGEAGFMCPSIVKYARPQRARATSGQWKYIVNTGEHTQTLRLEKCLKPKEACTYLTDNFKSKCVQVYNYHRLLTWDQQNGLHMDIFKVPTCCSCHIEGYSVNFPPLGHRVQETSSESFPGEDLSSDHGNNAFESVQPSVQRPKVVKNPPPFLLKPLETFPALSENHNHNHISSGFPSSKLTDTDFDNSQIPTGPIDSYGSSYFPDSFNQASSNRIVKRPGRKPVTSSIDSVTLPSYLEPPTPAGPSSFSFIKESPSKYKITSSTQYKRGAPRPSRRPIRKKLSGAPDDLVPVGTSIVESYTSANIETLEDFNDDLEDPEVIQPRPTIAPKLPSVSTEKSVASTTHRTVENQQDKGSVKDIPGGKRVNYNYHPIIDFFEEGKKDPESEAMDRDDSVPEYTPALDSEWKPINHPVSRSSQNNLLGRKKH